jgi:starch phosphorylase
MQIPCLPIADIELPRDVRKLYDLAYNLWWTWTPRARRLFSAIDSVAWTLYANPVQLLINIDRAHWEPLLGSETFMTTYSSVIKEFEAYVQGEDSAWFHQTHGKQAGGPIAYFAMEFGVHECFAGYSGGLGILSGDHLKSASDVGLPLVGVGLLYRRGYFRQTIDADGRQQHMYPHYDFTRLPMRPAAGHTGRDVIVSIDFPDREVFAKLWVAQIGRVPLVLLDTDIFQNDPSDRPITSILYVRGREMRIAQELVLGVGGVRALRALDIEPGVWHMNEGHSAFLQLERLREEIAAHGGTLAQAQERITSSSVFTTHTPVPAGNETFDEALVRKYAVLWARALEAPVDDVLALGRADGSSGQFNLTAFAIRTSRTTNAVSRLHGEVSNNMWRHLYPSAGPLDAPIRAITNGVHTSTWLGMEMLELFNRRLGLSWRDMLLAGEVWQAALALLDDELWAAHQAQKERLARFMRLRLREQFARHGCSPDELRAIEQLFSTEVLTIGFARRFATYKRADLIFRDLHRLRAIVGDAHRPVQILLAGKAHPADQPGQQLIQHIYQLTQSDNLRGKVFFLEDYDIRVARMLVQGVDVWLNTPRRPQEASGTSGQKAACNGALNLSVLDGWWPEAFNGRNGWVIGTESQYGDPELHDGADAQSLYQQLEEQVVPTYYERNEGGLPARWIAMMKDCIATITPRFSSSRMVREYAEQAYLPARSPAPPAPAPVSSTPPAPPPAGVSDEQPAAAPGR